MRVKSITENTLRIYKNDEIKWNEEGAYWVDGLLENLELDHCVQQLK